MYKLENTEHLWEQFSSLVRLFFHPKLAGRLCVICFKKTHISPIEEVGFRISGEQRLHLLLRPILDMPLSGNQRMTKSSIFGISTAYVQCTVCGPL